MSARSPIALLGVGVATAIWFVVGPSVAFGAGWAWLLLVGAVLLFCFHPVSRRDPLGPLGLTLLQFLVWGGFGSIVVVLYPGANTPIGKIGTTVTVTAAAVLLTIAGYAFASSLRVGERVALLRFDRPAGAIWGRAVLLYIVAWVARLLKAAIGAGHLPSNLGGLSVLVTPLSLASDAGLLVFGFLVSQLWVARTTLRRIPMVVAAATVLEVIGGALSGSRSAVIAPLAVLLIALRPRLTRLSAARLLGAFAMILAIGLPLSTAYRSHFFAGQRDGIPMSLDLVGRSAVGAIQILSSSEPNQDIPIDLPNDRTEILRSSLTRFSSTFETQMRVIDRVPARYPYSYGVPQMAGLGAYLIPRVLWPEKPLFTVYRESAQKYWDRNSSDSVTSIGTGLVGETYEAFGPLGVLLFAPYGVLLGAFALRLARYQRIDDAFLIIRYGAIALTLTAVNLTPTQMVTRLSREVVLGLVVIVLLSGRLPRVGTSSRGEKSRLQGQTAQSGDPAATRLVEVRDGQECS